MIVKTIILLLITSITLYAQEIKVNESIIIKPQAKEDRVRASHILLKTEIKAKKLISLLSRLKDDDLNGRFAELARSESEGPSKVHGGDLGYFGPGMMVPEFNDAVFAMEVGTITPHPVKTAFGYHIILLTDKKSSSTDPNSIDSSLDFDVIVKRRIESELKNIKRPNRNLQIQKDMFETQAEFETRVALIKSKQKIEIENFKRELPQKQALIQKEAIQHALKIKYGKPLLNNIKYDAENEYFVADLSFECKTDYKEKVAIKVPLKEAKKLYESINTIQPEAIFHYDNKSIMLKRIELPFKDKKYLAQFTDQNIDNTRVAVNIASDSEIDMSFSPSVTIAASEITSLDTSKLKSFNDLDKLLTNAQQAIQDKTKWLFVIGIEQYEFTDNISYAKRSAEMFTKTAQKTLGIPKTNSYIMLNSHASQTHIKTNMKKMLRRVKTGDTIYFYYNGHGIPVPSQNNEPYLLSYETEPDFVQDEKFFSLQNIYSTLSDSKANKVIAIVDSCFSGVTDAKAILKGVAATRVIAKRTKFNQDKMVVLSAGKAHQYSNAYNKKGHRLFSFYVMKNMLEGDKDIKTLYKDTKAQTYQTSLEEYGDGRTQEPTIEGNARMSL